MSRCILIVDDEENHRRTLSIGLRLEGFEVLEAQNAHEAMDVLEHDAADIAIVDLMMPGPNGLDLARRIGQQCPQVRVLLTSAYHLTERQLSRTELHVIGFLPKPYELQDLVGFLQQELNSAQPMPEA